MSMLLATDKVTPMSTSKSASRSSTRNAPALPAWASEAGWESDVVLSTRVRLARNLRGLSFPGRADEGDLRLVVDAVDYALRSAGKDLAALRPVDVGGL